MRSVACCCRCIVLLVCWLLAGAALTGHQGAVGGSRLSELEADQLAARLLAGPSFPDEAAAAGAASYEWVSRCVHLLLELAPERHWQSSPKREDQYEELLALWRLDEGHKFCKTRHQRLLEGLLASELASRGGGLVLSFLTVIGRRMEELCVRPVLERLARPESEALRHKLERTILAAAGAAAEAGAAKVKAACQEARQVYRVLPYGMERDPETGKSLVFSNELFEFRRRRNQLLEGPQQVGPLDRWSVLWDRCDEGRRSSAADWLGGLFRLKEAARWRLGGGR